MFTQNYLANYDQSSNELNQNLAYGTPHNSTAPIYNRRLTPTNSPVTTSVNPTFSPGLTPQNITEPPPTLSQPLSNPASIPTTTHQQASVAPVDSILPTKKTPQKQKRQAEKSKATTTASVPTGNPTAIKLQANSTLTTNPQGPKKQKRQAPKSQATTSTLVSTGNPLPIDSKTSLNLESSTTTATPAPSKEKP
ncbi:hypothetical protein PGT21_000312 [Puccinia graminis f. sp. tritici]|uniref:Uncharacterized protein n=1 Tax=Puccinia graminis f. sp. tritici TaxID=56615 RepID=A0A5B0LNH3_PUCGR|nr:hypothetical protein PGT21_000312 [Puccinia graminis f. sp. tritici]KAA1079908.1 hypothetical protein PGTUg99_000744 [Puccinia graminis f. sp. tritici]